MADSSRPVAFIDLTQETLDMQELQGPVCCFLEDGQVADPGEVYDLLLGLAA